MMISESEEKRGCILTEERDDEAHLFPQSSVKLAAPVGSWNMGGQ